MDWYLYLGCVLWRLRSLLHMICMYDDRGQRIYICMTSSSCVCAVYQASPLPHLPYWWHLLELLSHFWSVRLSTGLCITERARLSKGESLHKQSGQYSHIDSKQQKGKSSIGTLGPHKMQMTVSQVAWQVSCPPVLFILSIYFIQQGHCLVLAHTVVDTEPTILVPHILECPVEINSVVIEWRVYITSGLTLQTYLSGTRCPTPFCCCCYFYPWASLPPSLLEQTLCSMWSPQNPPHVLVSPATHWMSMLRMLLNTLYLILLWNSYLELTTWVNHSTSVVSTTCLWLPEM